MSKPPHGPLRDARTDRDTAAQLPGTDQTRSPSYRLAFGDEAFLCRDDLRPVRLQLELLKCELLLKEQGIERTIVMFGGARIKPPKAGESPASNDMSRFYEEARAFARAMTQHALACNNRDYVVVTGGGPGVMEAGNRGAHEAGGISIGLGIVLPHESEPNPYVTPELAFNFHYFAIRKMHFLMRARAICVFPGGFGTLDELFETLTLIQTGRMQPVPVLLFGRAFWEGVINWQSLVDAGTIRACDLDLVRFVENADEAVEAIMNKPGPSAEGF